MQADLQSDLHPEASAAETSLKYFRPHRKDAALVRPAPSFRKKDKALPMVLSDSDTDKTSGYNCSPLPSAILLPDSQEFSRDFHRNAAQYLVTITCTDVGDDISPKPDKVAKHIVNTLKLK